MIQKESTFLHIPSFPRFSQSLLPRSLRPTTALISGCAAITCACSFAFLETRFQTSVSVSRRLSSVVSYAVNYRVINRRWIGRDLEGDGTSRTEDIRPAFTRKASQIPRTASVRIAVVSAARSEPLECFAHLLGDPAVPSAIAHETSLSGLTAVQWDTYTCPPYTKTSDNISVRLYIRLQCWRVYVAYVTHCFHTLRSNVAGLSVSYMEGPELQSLRRPALLAEVSVVLLSPSGKCSDSSSNETVNIFQNCWVSGLRPSSGILHNTERNVSETGSVCVCRWGEGDNCSVASHRKS
jgi:hypothetical protein